MLLLSLYIAVVYHIALSIRTCYACWNAPRTVPATFFSQATRFARRDTSIRTEFVQRSRQCKYANASASSAVGALRHG
jgi:hypothetical protein